VAEPDRPLLADAAEEVAQLGSDLLEIAELRWRLARLELEAAADSVKRLVILAAVAAVTALTGLSVLLVGIIHLLPEVWHAGTLLTLGLVLLLGAVALVWWARGRFRRKFVGLEETLEEFREDLVWFREWTGGASAEE
jgi:uncharacterized membrane protein YqjE